MAATATATITIPQAKAIVKRHNHNKALNFHQDIDVDKRIFDSLKNYENVYQMNGELLVVGKKGQEFFISNKYSVSED